MTECTTEHETAPGQDAEGVIRTWLLDYAWNGTPQEQAAEVDCIMAQDGWKYLDARVEQLMGQRSGERTVAEDLGDAHGMALSALYECHDGPHQATCPNYRPAPAE